jgi:hypothetical protein
MTLLGVKHVTLFDFPTAREDEDGSPGWHWRS